MAAEAAHHLRRFPQVARALYAPLVLGRALGPPADGEQVPAPGLLGPRLGPSSSPGSSSPTPAHPAGRAEDRPRLCLEPRPSAPREDWSDGCASDRRPRQHHNGHASAGERASPNAWAPCALADAPCIAGSCSGTWDLDRRGFGQGRHPGVAWRDLPSGIGPMRAMSGKAGRKSSAKHKNPSAGAEEGPRAGDGSREEGQPRGDEGAVSVRELAHLEENTSVLLRRAEIEGLLVEGLPVGLERELSPDAGPPAAAYPFLLRKNLRDFLQALDAHARAVRGAESTARGAGEGGGEASDPLLAGGAASGAGTGAVAPSSGALRRQWLLVGPRGSGKSVLLGLAAAWARANGWLVLYVPRARDWVRGGLYYPHPHAPAVASAQGLARPQGARCTLWDTPVQAQQALENLLAAHRDILAECPLQNREALPLGEAPSVDRAPQQRMRPLPSAAEEPLWSLADLASLGAEERDAAVSALLRLKEELPHLQGTPVLIAIDEYNAWFTFSAYFESTGDRSRRQIHANELRMVRSLRPMAQDSPGEAGASASEEGAPSPVALAAAFSESIAVGRLAPRLPGVPRGASFPVPRFSLSESRQLLENHLKRRDGPLFQELSDNMVLRAHHLAVGSGADIRKLSLLIDSSG